MSHLFKSAVVTLLGVWMSTFSTPSPAWGERGHAAVTHVAVRLIQARFPDDKRFVTPFEKKEFMLAHLSNVPDIVWKNLPKKIVDMNGPMHYIDLEYIMKNPSFPAIVMSAGQAGTIVKSSGKDLRKDVGSAPWRIEQLARNMTRALETLKNSSNHGRKGRSDVEDAVNLALLQAGLMSHFVGDISHPYHTTKDYDGWDSGQGGVHALYDSTIIDALPLDLENEVFNYALKEKPYLRIASMVKDGKLDAAHPLHIAFALALDSYSNIPRAAKLDRDIAVIKPSHASPSRIPAERKPIQGIAGEFRSLIVERLAVGADTLAAIWRLQWQKAGEPDLSQYHSWTYPVAPDFIEADYFD